MSSAQNEPKLHHYLPRAYLRHFANDGLLMVRRRGAAPKPLPVPVVAAQNHLYSLRLDDGTYDAETERTLAKFDGAGAAAMDGLRSGKIPRAGTDDRHAVALFMALLMARTPEYQDQIFFARDAVEYFDTDDTAHITRDQVRTYLRDVHLGFDPQDPEVEAAWSFVSAQVAMGLPTKEDALKIMFELVLSQFAPRLENLAWSIEVCRKPRFATCDRLPAAWKRPSAEDAFQGVGIAGAEQVLFPVSPTHMLVIRHAGSEAVEHVEPKRARFVNAHLAKHCYRMVLHNPGLPIHDGDFTMSRHRPASRFWQAPGLTVAPDGSSAPMGDIIHMWVPIQDHV